MRAMANGALSRFNPAQPGAQGMKVVATGLLVVMAAVFFATRAFEQQYPALSYVKAFAEAAMVGGLADWFAVTALFRHPLGLPIPHTAIIPRNKDRIGEALASFLKENFLIPAVVARRMQRLDVAGAAGRDPGRMKDLCHQAGANCLALFHHEPTYQDEDIERMHQESIRYEELTRTGDPLEVICAYDGLEVAV